jgi:hypothetical protein
MGNLEGTVTSSSLLLKDHGVPEQRCLRRAVRSEHRFKEDVNAQRSFGGSENTDDTRAGALLFYGTAERLAAESDAACTDFPFVSFSEYLMRQYNARNPSFQPIFLPSS